MTNSSQSYCCNTPKYMLSPLTGIIVCNSYNKSLQDMIGRYYSCDNCGIKDNKVFKFLDLKVVGFENIE